LYRFITQRLERSRLVTVTGPTGSGTASGCLRPLNRAAPAR
jgi:hypothetical protein